ncbi:MAG: hypothetical protein F6K24_40055 [Okeania sp. SIO2D1]|nr:hypothetical protein [Okeania sp. SIO2D1]
MCLPESKIVCVDADLLVELLNLLCVKQFEIKNQQTHLYFVEKVLKHFDILTRFTLKRGFFSCGFPHKEDLDKVLTSSPT